jgi:hypothetical protein
VARQPVSCGSPAVPTALEESCWCRKPRRRGILPTRPPVQPLTFSPSISPRSSLLGLKKGTLFGGTSTGPPVFGLRPMRPSLWRVRKLPNPRISTLFPDRRARTMLSSMAQTTSSDSSLYGRVAACRSALGDRRGLTVHSRDTHYDLRFPIKPCLREYQSPVSDSLPAGRTLSPQPDAVAPPS